jgi:hypothetical protein
MISTSEASRPCALTSDRDDASHRLGEELRAKGGAGLLYDSLRRRTGVNVVAHCPIASIERLLKLSAFNGRQCLANARFARQAVVDAKSVFRPEADIEPFSRCGAACKMRLAIKPHGSEDIRSVGVID